VFEVTTINYLESPIDIGDNIHSAAEYLGDDQIPRYNARISFAIQSTAGLEHGSKAFVNICT
jgi:hypothetical protein